MIILAFFLVIVIALTEPQVSRTNHRDERLHQQDNGPGSPIDITSICPHMQDDYKGAVGVSDVLNAHLGGVE